ncbi:MAG: aldehyde ferredoxin oxidoreductase family protein [Desulfurococcales archaeon]|nr:aldehyde ferredoxin oxidoreductase family protein [Desulfurococcales archaeon]
MRLRGYHWRILRVNLSTGRWRVEEPGEEDLELFIGGKALAYLMAYREIPPGTDPLSPSNRLYFVTGPFSALVPGASKVTVLAKSPLTRLLNDSHAGDYFGPSLRKAGYDALVVEGASRDPVYIYIDSRTVEVRDASRIWGSTTREATRAIRRETSERASVAAIGPAGERLVRIANIIFDEERAAGRGGLGAVMGSKKLKAIAVLGDGRPPEPADPEGLRAEGEKWYNYFATSPRYGDLRTYGTTNALVYSASIGMSPSYNFETPGIPVDLAAKISGDAIKEVEVDPPWYIHGASCPIKCARYAEAEYKGRRFRVKPEYENLAMLGAATGVFDREAVLYFNRLVDDLGLDSISTGNTIAWLLELAERGLIGEEEVGFKVKGFGDAEAVERLIRLIAERRGIGAVLAEGVKRASEILGRGAELAVHVKGLEAPAWDPRGRRGFAVSYATADVGASHLRGWPPTTEPPSAGPAKEVVPGLARNRDDDALRDSLSLCRFVSYPSREIPGLYKLVTGLERSLDDLYRAPQRAEALARIHAALDWLVPPIHDDVPPKWMKGQPTGPLKGVAAFLSEEDKREAIREYYRVRGWHPTLGVPTPETMERLGIPWARGDAERALRAVEERLRAAGLEV